MTYFVLRLLLIEDGSCPQIVVTWYVYLKGFELIDKMKCDIGNLFLHSMNLVRISVRSFYYFHVASVELTIQRLTD